MAVVPYWMGSERLDRDPELIAWLRNHPGEKVLHGFTHASGRNWWNALWYGTANHDEFARLDEHDSLARLRRAMEIYRACFGSPPRWFCAPRWRQSAAAGKALTQLGLRAVMLRERILVQPNRSVPLPAVCFDEGRRWAAQWTGRLRRAGQLRRLLHGGRSFRLTLHPADLNHKATWMEIRHLIANLEQGGWEPISLEEAIPLYRDNRTESVDLAADKGTEPNIALL